MLYLHDLAKTYLSNLLVRFSNLSEEELYQIDCSTNSFGHETIQPVEIFPCWGLGWYNFDHDLESTILGLRARDLFIIMVSHLSLL